MQIVIVCEVVKFSGAEAELLDDYAKRIGRRFKFNLSSAKADKEVKESDFVVVLDERGQKFDNLSFAKRFEGVLSSGRYKRVVFVVGNAYGVDTKLKERADLTWSFSDQVFPHRLFTIMATEQIYRTLEINSGSPYHHE